MLWNDNSQHDRFSDYGSCVVLYSTLIDYLFFFVLLSIARRILCSRGAIPEVPILADFREKMTGFREKIAEIVLVVAPTTEYKQIGYRVTSKRDGRKSKCHIIENVITPFLCRCHPRCTIDQQLESRWRIGGHCRLR